MQTKTCSKCHFEKPISEYYSAGNGKLRPDCKPCHRAVANAHGDPAYQPKIQQPVDSETRKARFLAARRRADIKYKATHPDRVRSASRRWYKEHPEQAKLLGQQWSRENKRKKAVYDQRRAARKASAIGDFTLDEWERLCSECDHQCLCCGKRAFLTVDHIVPLVRGGSNYITNIQPLCKSCNSSKKDKTIDYRISK